MSYLDLIAPDCAFVLPCGRIEMLEYIPKGRRAAEIGVFRGGFSHRILRYAKPAHLTLVDAWDLEIENGDVSVPHYSRFTPSSFGRLAQLVPIVLRVLHPFASFKAHQSLSVPAAAQFKDGEFDWVYIDADHSYQGALADLRAWAPKVREDGLIIGHDFTDREGFGVIRAVREFTEESEYRLLCITTDLHPTFVLTRTISGFTEAFVENVFRSRMLIYRLPTDRIMTLHHLCAPQGEAEKAVVSVLC